MSSSCSEVFDPNGLDGVGRFEVEDARIEVQLGVERAFDVLGAPEAVPFALEWDVRDRKLLLSQDLDHPFALVLEHDPVFVFLKDDAEALEPIVDMDHSVLAVD